MTNIFTRLNLPGLRRQRTRREPRMDDNVGPAPNNAPNPTRHPFLDRIPRALSAFVHRNRGRNADDRRPDDNTGPRQTNVTTATNPPVLPQVRQLQGGGTRGTEPIITTPTPPNLQTQSVIPTANSGAPQYKATREHIVNTPNYGYQLIADRYRRYQSGDDTLSSKDPQPEAFNLMEPLERHAFYKKLPADRQANLKSKLTDREWIAVATAPHADMLKSLLADEGIRKRSQEIASGAVTPPDAKLIKDVRIKLTDTTLVPVEDLLTDQQQVEFLKKLDTFAPHCQSQYFYDRGRPGINATATLNENPDIAKDYGYFVSLKKPTALTNSRLTLSVAPKDVLLVAEEIVKLAQADDASMANTMEMKVLGPRDQGRRYDSIIVNFEGFDCDGAKKLAAKLRSALPNVKWLKQDSFMLDEISDGCAYGETRIGGHSVALEHAEMFADTLVEIASDPRVGHDAVLQANIREHGRSLKNPALIHRALPQPD